MFDEINRHFEAALALSRLDFLCQLVSEAELCIKFDQASAAAILAGIALEELSSSRDLKFVQTSEPSLQAWRQIRNRAAHPAVPGNEEDRKAVAEMVKGIRAILDEIDRPDVTLRRSMLSGNALMSVKGKYAFVPTSVEDFLKRKREDVELENRE